MKKRKQKELGGKSTSVIIALLGIGVLVLFLSFGLVPMQKSLDDMDLKIAELKERIEIEKKLMPLYVNLEEKIKMELPELYPVPEKKTLPRYQIEEVLPTFARIAEESDMAIVFIDPDIIGLENKPGLLEIDVVIQGDFFNFRNFLIEIAGIPYLEEIGEIKVERVASSLKFGMKILLAVS
jgi:hypothetical protein